MKTDLLKFYDETRRHYGVYHNHKETCAWAALVLHLVFCGTIIKVSSATEYIRICNVFISICIITESLLIIFYMQWQFLMKDDAAAIVAATTVLQLEIISLEESASGRLIEHIQIEESGDLDLQSRHCLPLKLQKKAHALNARGRGAQTATRILAFTLVVFSMISAVAARWI